MPPFSYPSWLSPRGADVLLDILVAPRASRTRIIGEHDKRLKIQLSAPPVDGQANEALVRFLAEALSVSKAQVSVVGGATNKRKTVKLAGVDPHVAFVRLGGLS